MKKSDELKNQITALRTEVEKLQAAEQIDDAQKKAKELTDLVNEYKTAKALEDSDFKNFAGNMVSANAIADKDDKKLINRAFNKLVFGDKFGWKLTDEEKAVADKIINAAGTPGQVGATPSKGGYLIPTEQTSQLLEYRRSYTALKDFCSVRTANSRNGQQPTIGEEDGMLTAFEELNEIAQNDVDFGQITYAVKDYGDIIPIANQLLQDADIDLMSVIGQRFARKSINTENAKILDILKSLTATTATDYKAIQTALNKTLDPAISASSAIFTNQSGYDYLDNLTDTNKRPLLTASLADPTQYMFKGRRVVMLKDSLLANDVSSGGNATTYAPFIIGAMGDLIHFFDRKGVEIAVSTEAGFTKYATYVRAVERFDVQKVDAEAMVSLKIKVD